MLTVDKLLKSPRCDRGICGLESRQSTHFQQTPNASGFLHSRQFLLNNERVINFLESVRNFRGIFMGSKSVRRQRLIANQIVTRKGMGIVFSATRHFPFLEFARRCREQRKAYRPIQNFGDLN